MFASIATMGAPLVARSQRETPKPSGLTRDEWMAGWIDTKGLGPQLRVGRFKDRMYFLLRDIWWEPKDPKKIASSRITAPSGFVTDFASIPRAFWSELAPDEDYAYAAVVHDWLYWTQSTSREKADAILKAAMEELEVHPVKVALIYAGVRSHFGEAAWNGNAALKKAGEKRILKSSPDDAMTTWAEWKRKPGVFK
jgi:hypothetical protein